MTNPIIEKKVAEIFRNIDEMRNPEIVRKALTDMYEMGQGKGNENGYELGVDVGKKTGAADMKERILEVLPKSGEQNGHWPKDIFSDPWKGWQNDIDTLAKTKGKRIDNVSAHLGRWAYSIAFEEIRAAIKSIQSQ